MKKLILISFVFGVALSSCKKEEKLLPTPPCADWWLGITLNSGCTFEDVDNDGEPDLLTYIDANGTATTITCIDDLNGNCIPDCYEPFIGNSNGGGSGNNPCAGWWQNLVLVNGAVLTDSDNDGVPDILTYTDASGNTTTYTCTDDLNGDCIPDCFEQFVDNGSGSGSGNGNGGGNNPCAGWWQNLIMVNGAVLIDSDNDGIPDILNYTDANGNITTYTCIDDLNGDCIPDCFEQFIDNGSGGGNGNGGGNNPCAGWWQNLILINGAVLVDIDNDGIPDILNYDDGNGNVSTYTCIDDLNGDCIPDCYEQFVL